MFLIFFILSPKREFSENENRYLKDFPEFSIHELKRGTFTEDLSAYIRDHFPLRDQLMGLNTTFGRYIMGKREMNGVYFADDDYYIEKYNAPQNTDKILDTFNKFKEKTDGAQVYLCLAPTAITVYEDKLPDIIPEISQIDTIDHIYNGFEGEKVDVTSVLMNAERKAYYRLDHHWTTYGAYLAYCELGNKMGFIPLSEDDFDIETVTEDFRGSIFSKLDIPWLKGESIEVYRSDKPVSMHFEDSGETLDSLYNFEYADKKDKYSLFLDNIHSLITIESPQAEKNETIAIVKDSYANCLVPFLAEHYKKIYVFDTRYYKGSVSEFVNENDIDKVLFMYNMNTIDTDLGVGAVY